MGILAWKRMFASLQLRDSAGLPRLPCSAVTGFPGSSQSIRAHGSLCRDRLSRYSIEPRKSMVKRRISFKTALTLFLRL